MKSLITSCKRVSAKPLVCIALVAVIVSCVCFLAGCQSEQTYKAVYKGIAGYGTVQADDVKQASFNGYQFEINGQIKQFRIKETPNFELQNQLEEGRTYTITVEKDRVTALSTEPETTSFIPRVSGQPGQKNLTNFLRLALEPVGTTLYAYGGGWNWQDDAAGPQAMQLGIAPEWVNFYQAHKGNYNLKYVKGTGNTVEDKTGAYPYGEWNEYYYIGLDCSGYVGWTFFNYVNDQAAIQNNTYDKSGYVMFSRKQAEFFSQLGYGSFSKNMNDLKPGDIISLKSHVWICLGTCSDGSVVVLHSAATEDANGEESGGVQLSAINPNETGEDCEAFKLAQSYMQKYYPEWTSYYPTVLKDYQVYTDLSNTTDGGVFSWSTGESGELDPDGLQGKSAAEVLEILFKDAR